MRGEVHSMGDYSRKNLPSAREGTHFDGFCKALVFLKTLNLCGTVIETQLSLQNLMNAELLTREENEAFYKYFGWELTQ
jgi:hypothetical protein